MPRGTIALFLVEFAMKKWTVAFLLWCSCAPLTSPAGGPEDWQKPEPSAPPPNALEQYLEKRQRYGSGPRPDFVAVVPFVDESGFREGVWNVEYELANMVSAELAAARNWEVVPFNAVAELALEWGFADYEKALAIGRELGADFVIVGLLQDYDMRRLSVGDPLLGGYKSYSAVAQMSVEIVRADDGSAIGKAEALRELTDRDVGLDLLGKPREQDLQFAGLKELEFGSEEFRQALLGQATVEAVGELVQKVAAAFEPEGLVFEGDAPEVIAVYSEDIYANIGSEHGIRPRLRFFVYPGNERIEAEGLAPEESVALVEVVEIISTRLASLRVLRATGEIKAGDRLEVAEGE